MRIQTLRYLVAASFVIFQAVQIQAQVVSYNPFFVVNSGGNLYRPEQGLLTLPSVQVFPAGSNTQSNLLNVVLRHTGGNSFELVSVDELEPEQECTRDEVREAIPLLDLDMTIEEAETLIGCVANLRPGSVDLTTGREVIASWIGNDGVPNSSNGYIGTSYIRTTSSTWIGGTSNSVFRSPGTTGSTPSIAFVLRENVLQSISYSDQEQFQFCYNEELLAGFRQIDLSYDYSDVVDALGCEGNLQWVGFDDANLQQDYLWQVPPGPQSGMPVPAGVEASSLSESIQVTVLNDQVESLRYDSTRQFASPDSCTVEDLEAAQGKVQTGQTDLLLGVLLDCGVRTETLSSTGFSESSSYRWQTAIPNESFFTSSNRALMVNVQDGVVVSVRLDRF